MAAEDQSQQPFSLRAHNVVLATARPTARPASASPSGGPAPSSTMTCRPLRRPHRAGTVSLSSDPVLIIGAGLSAADAVLYARHYGVPVIHASVARGCTPRLGTQPAAQDAVPRVPQGAPDDARAVHPVPQSLRGLPQPPRAPAAAPRRRTARPCSFVTPRASRRRVFSRGPGAAAHVPTPICPSSPGRAPTSPWTQTSH